ncbi:MAG: radical SAM protein [Lachnospiraceae bacterium]
MKENTGCMLCPRRCGADRAVTTGICGVFERIKVARAALHEWEEPCISGTNGSGTVFFSGCALHCVYCQNGQISGGEAGIEMTPLELTDIFLRLQNEGAHNINLVTPAHYIDALIPALLYAKEKGLHLPVVYNTGAYELVDTLKRLEGLIDVWLPDIKYIDEAAAARYSNAPDYFTVASAAIAEMHRQAGTPIFDENGLMVKGVLIRHLVLPGQTKAAKRILKYLYETYGNSVYISIMSQYTPLLKGEAANRYPELTRRVTKREYDAVVNEAISMGLENAFIQEGNAAKESFIPAFDGTGV